MTRIDFIAGAVAVLDRSGIDTDQILPVRFLRVPRGDDLGAALFHDLRAADPSFLWQPAGNPPVLLAGADFGRGGLRDAAVHALLDAGFRCVIAPGLGHGFAGLAFHNGLLAVDLPTEAFAGLRTDCLAGAPVVVDVERERISCAAFTYHIRIDRFRKRCLLLGVEELTLTRSSEIADAIDRFEGADVRHHPWATPT
jgi:3-isopropylmalate/(R)-2-methylmalate dehydratase small subunit